MHIVIAFVVVFLLAFLVLSFLEAVWRNHTMRSGLVMSDWLSIVGVATGIAVVVALAFGGLWSLFAMIFGW